MPTLPYLQLCFGRVRATVSSFDKNEGPLPGLNAAGQHLRVVDWPGHVRMRHALLDTLAPRALGVVYVVDSTAIKKNPSDVAEYSSITASKSRSLPRRNVIAVIFESLRRQKWSEPRISTRSLRVLGEWQ